MYWRDKHLQMGLGCTVKLVNGILIRANHYEPLRGYSYSNIYIYYMYVINPTNNNCFYFKWKFCDATKKDFHSVCIRFNHHYLSIEN